MPKQKPETSKCTELLPVPLTDEVKLIKSAEIGKLLDEHTKLTADKKRAADRYKGLMDGHMETIRELGAALLAGTVEEEVECEQTKDFAKGIVTLVRLDTGEVVSERDMQPDERQGEL